MTTATAIAYPVLLPSVALLVSVRQATLAFEFESALNTVSLNFTNAHTDPSMNSHVIFAFVPSVSRPVNCLTSLDESNNAMAAA